MIDTSLEEQSEKIEDMIKYAIECMVVAVVHAFTSIKEIKCRNSSRCTSWMGRKILMLTLHVYLTSVCCSSNGYQRPEASLTTNTYLSRSYAYSKKCTS